MKEFRDLFDKLGTVIPFFKEFERKVYIAGGCIRSSITGEYIRDVDIFLRDNTLIDRLKELNLGIVSDNAISFWIDCVQYQIIIGVTNEPLALVNEFDFTMNINYYDPISNELYVQSTNDIRDKILRINPNCRNKLGTLGRVFKFLQRGYQLANRNTLLQIGVQLTEHETVKTFEQLEKASKLYFSQEEHDSFELLEKEPYENTSSAKVKQRGSGF